MKTGVDAMKARARAIRRVRQLKSRYEWFNSLDVETFIDGDLVGVCVRHGGEQVVFDSSLLFESDAFAINGIAAALQVAKAEA